MAIAVVCLVYSWQEGMGLAINETAIPAAVARPARDWWFPLRVSVFLAVGLPLIVLAALLSAAMEGGADERD